MTAEDVRGAGAMAVILRDALQPNLLQTLENTPVLVHAGPFGNIAHGNSSVVADLIGIHTGDFLITEAGFGADMGAERFFNIKCRVSGLVPDAAVVVTTVRALKAHSGAHRIVAGRPLPPALLAENPDEVRVGAANLVKQIENVRLHGVTPVVAVNAFPDDFPSEHEAIREIAASLGVRCAVTTHFADGGAGATELAEAVAEAAEEPELVRIPLSVGGAVAGQDRGDCHPGLRGRRRRLLPCRRPHPGPARVRWLRWAVGVHRQDPPVDLVGPDPEGRPHRMAPARSARSGSRPAPGFAYAICGDMRTMPGLGSHPAAFDIDLDEHGDIVGLY